MAVVKQFLPVIHSAEAEPTRRTCTIKAEQRDDVFDSPRAVLHAIAMHAGGFNKEWIMKACVWRGMPEVDRASIIATAGI